MKEESLTEYYRFKKKKEDAGAEDSDDGEQCCQCL